MIIDGTGFNLEYWGQFLSSVTEFVEAGIRERIYHGEVKQVLKLRAAYELISFQSEVTGV